MIPDFMNPRNIRSGIYTLAGELARGTQYIQNSKSNIQNYSPPLLFQKTRRYCQLINPR